jgi:hypothetical protein
VEAGRRKAELFSHHAPCMNMIWQPEWRHLYVKAALHGWCLGRGNPCRTLFRRTSSCWPRSGRGMTEFLRDAPQRVVISCRASG